MEQVNATSGLPGAGGTAQQEGRNCAPAKAVGPQRPRNPKLWKAATDFQEVILSQFTQAMRTAEKDNDLVEKCPGSETFDQMFSDAIAHEMSQSGALGLNKSIYRAMGGTYEKAPVASASTLARERGAAALPERGAAALQNRAPGTASPQAPAGRVIPAKLVPRANGAAGIHIETAE